MELEGRALSEHTAYQWLQKNDNDLDFFCTPRWDTFLRKTYHAKRHFIGLYDQSKIMGVWPAYIIRKGPIKILGAPLRGWFTPWLDPEFSREILDSEIGPLSRKATYAFDRYADQKGFDYIECASRFLNDSDMRQLHYEPLKKATAILDISRNPDDLIKTFSKTCQKRIKRAIKQGCTVKDISAIDFVPELWRMTLEVYAKNGMGPAHNPDTIGGILESHMDSGHLFVWEFTGGVG